MNSIVIESPLIPEIAIGHSGLKEQTQLYQDIFQQLNQHGHILPTHSDPNDESAFMHYSLSRLYAMSTSKDRHLGICFSKGFLSLMGTIDKKIPFSHLPESHFSYIHFPEEFLFDGEEFLEGAYFFLGKSSLLSLGGSKFTDKNILAISYVTKEKKSYGSLLVATEDQTKLSEIISGYPCENYTLDGAQDASHMQPQREVIFRTLLNCILWLTCCSGDDKVKIAKPTPAVHKKKLQKLKRKYSGIYNFSKIPFAYFDDSPLRKIIILSKSKTKVSGHLRWQPHGLKRGLLKLIWISEHERHYKM